MAISDNTSYQATKNILRGKAIIHPHFQRLTSWINESYGVLPINIIYTLKKQQPELEIYFVHQHEAALFYHQDGYTFNLNIREAIGQKMQQLVKEQRVESKYVVENIWIFCRALDTLVRAEAEESIPSATIAQLKETFTKEGLWEISRVYAASTFFVHTRQQITELANNGTLKRWTDTYFQLLKQYDEFNCLQRESFSLLLDSRENFMDKYSGNWYYYYK